MVSKLLSTFPSSLPVSSSKLQGKRLILTEIPASTLSPSQVKKSVLGTSEPQGMTRVSSIPLRIGSISQKSSNSPLKTQETSKSSDLVNLQQSTKHPDTPKKRASSVMNPTAASSMRSLTQKKSSSTFPSPVSRRLSVKPPASKGSPNRRFSTHNLQRSLASSPEDDPQPRSLPRTGHTRQSLPPTNPGSTFSSSSEFKSKTHSLARSSKQVHEPTDSRAFDHSKSRNPRPSTIISKSTTASKEHPAIPSLAEEPTDTLAFHTTFAEKQKLKNRLSMQIYPATHRTMINRKSMGASLNPSESFKDSKYSDFPSSTPQSPTNMLPPPKPIRKPRSNSITHQPRQLPPLPKGGSTASLERRSTVASKSVSSSKSISSLPGVGKSSTPTSHHESTTPTKSIMKSQTTADLQNPSPLNPTLGRSNSKRINFGSPSKSPYRPLNRPAHVYPLVHKKTSATEEETLEKKGLDKIRSKSTVAKQWPALSNIDSDSVKRLVLSPFSADSKQKGVSESRRTISGSRNESPLEVKDAVSEEERQIQSIMKTLVKTMPEDDRSIRRYEEARKAANFISEPLTPSLAAKSHRLNMYERGEILDYRNVYFTGRPDVKKISGDIRHASNNYGFDDGNGDYQVIPGDHIAYRYEILSVLGKGSFGKVLKCVDHKSGKLVAVKMIINRKRFHMQALIEADILRALSQWVSAMKKKKRRPAD